MGQVLYRKYRSKNLGEIVGQEHITTTLEKAIKTGRISHAYLLTGPRGVGKTSVARIMAYEVNGLPYDEDSTHLDIIEIDAASNRRIDEIRELRDKVHIAPAAAKYKVYIIDEVHMLTREAFNALLKTLEEPPAHAIFILATTEAYKLPETIVSRTQRFTFRPIDQGKVVEHLKDIAKKEKITIDDEALEIIARHGEGSFRDSISLLDQLASSGQKITTTSVLETLGEAPAEQIDKLSSALFIQNASEIVKVLHQMVEQGYEPSRIAKQLSQKLRAELVEGQSRLDYQATLNLLARLLDVSKTSDPNVALELALLKSISIPQVSNRPTRAAPPDAPATPRPAAKPVEPKSISKQAEKIANPVEKLKMPETKPEQKKTQQNTTDTSNSSQPTAEVTELGADLDQVWQDVMSAIKKQHNTLYSVMRLSQPVWEDGNLKICFGFVFHQKRINEPKNREIVAKIVEGIIGHPVNVSSVLDEDLKPEVVTDGLPNTSADDSIISNISNIFGGAELIES